MRRFPTVLLAGLLLLAVMGFSGCAFKNVDQMFCLPKQSENSAQLQSVINQEMKADYTYAAPKSGENQQAVQMVDLDGDAALEAVVYAKSQGAKPLKIFVFDQNEQEQYQLLYTIEGDGTAFESVEYIKLDKYVGLEMVVGRQISDQVLHSVSVYSFAGNKLSTLLHSNYTEFVTSDLDNDNLQELLILKSEAGGKNGVAELYNYEEDQLVRSKETVMSAPAENVKRIVKGQAGEETPAIFVASIYDENSIITDVYAMKNGVFTNITASNESGNSVQTVRNYYVYATDIDRDGLVELPALTDLKIFNETPDLTDQYLIRWYNLTAFGREETKLYTFHNYADGWYMELPDDWISQISLGKGDEIGGTKGYVFYQWDGNSSQAEVIFTIYAFSGNDRVTLAGSDGRFELGRTEDVVYAASLGEGKLAKDLTQDDVIKAFHFIRIDWNTGEM